MHKSGVFLLYLGNAPKSKTSYLLLIQAFENPPLLSKRRCWLWDAILLHMLVLISPFLSQLWKS